MVQVKCFFSSFCFLFFKNTNIKYNFTEMKPVKAYGSAIVVSCSCSHAKRAVDATH